MTYVGEPATATPDAPQATFAPARPRVIGWATLIIVVCRPDIARRWRCAVLAGQDKALPGLSRLRQWRLTFMGKAIGTRCSNGAPADCRRWAVRMRAVVVYMLTARQAVRYA